MKKIIYSVFTFITFFCFMKTNTQAYDDTITATTVGDRLYMNEELEVYTESISPRYVRFYMKYAGDTEHPKKYQIACLSGFTVPRPTDGTVCTIDDNWDKNMSYGVGYIHKAISASSSADYLKYWWDSYLALYYVGNIEDEYSNSEVMERILGTTMLDTGKTFQQIINDAHAHANLVNNLYIRANNQQNLEVTFTLNNDGYYYSDEVTITTNGKNYYVSGIESTSPKFSYTQNGNKFVFKIKASDVEYGSTETLNTLVTTNFEKYNASKYDCGSGVQSVSIFGYESAIESASVNIHGTVTKSYGQLTIKKVDESGHLLAGAKIKITGPNNYSNTITTTTSATVIRNLPYGTYTIEEVEAPTGYVKSVNKTATLSSTNLNLTVTLTDKITKVKVSKKAATGDDELPGATLEIQDKDGNIVKYCTDAEGNTGKDCKWVSTEEPYEIEGLPVGTYYLVETIAPSKYVVNKEKVSFTVKEDGTVTEVEMRNSLNKVVISKVSVTDSKEIPGAELEIQDKDGNIVKYCTDAEGNTGKDCKWVSTEEPYEIEGMPNGTYYLVETLAPEGYELTTEKVEFAINGSKATTNVSMKNEVKVDVPDTLSSKSIILIAVAMLDIALGIGIITYVKKNKINE